jgi:thiol-disulfide isomerase/thioredoxin
VIEIGWQVLLIPLVVMAVVGGYWVGKQFNRSPSQLQAGAPSVDPANGINPLEIQSDPNRAPIIITLEPSQLEQFGGSQGGFGDAPMALPPPSHPLMGQPAPDFVMKRLSDGQEVKISDLKGKTVMVNFWATWCPPCRLEMPWLESVYGKHKDQGFELLAVDAGEKVPPSMVEDQVKQFVERMGLTFPTLLGDNTYDVQREYSVYGLPSTFIIDPNGTVIDYHNGMYPNEATLEAQIQKAFGSAENAEN